MPPIVDPSIVAAGVVAHGSPSGADALPRSVKVDDGMVPDLFWHEMRDSPVKAGWQGQGARGADEGAASATPDRAPAAAARDCGVAPLGPLAP